METTRRKRKRKSHLNVHSRQLTPHLIRHTKQHPPPHVRLEQIKVRPRRLSLLKLDLLSDFGVFELDERRVAVAGAVDVCEDLEGFVVAAFVPVYGVREVNDEEGEKEKEKRDVHEPARGLGEEPHGGAEDETGDELETPRKAEGSVAVDVCSRRKRVSSEGQRQ